MNFGNRDSILENSIFNNDYVSNINNSLKFTRWFLRLLGIWPHVISDPTTIDKNIAKILLPLSSVSMIILVIPILAHITIQRSERSEVIIFIAPITFFITNIIKHFIMIVRLDSIKLCMRHMEIDWRRIENSNDREIMLRNLRVVHRLTTIFTLCMYSCATLYNVVMPLCSGNAINEFNETIRPVVFPGTDVFFDFQANIITYEIVFCSNFVSALFHFTVSTGVCNFAAILVSHACGQIQIVISRLEELVSPGIERDVNAIDKRIAFIIQNHARVITFGKNIEKLLREMCLMEVLAETLVICFVGYCCIMEWSNSDHLAILTYAILLGSFSASLFLYCEVGEVFKEQCQKVGKAAYMIEWYRLPGKASLSLMLIIITSSYPCKLTAGGMMELSRISFGRIMKTSFAYLNILRTAV